MSIKASSKTTRISQVRFNREHLVKMARLWMAKHPDSFPEIDLSTMPDDAVIRVMTNERYSDGCPYVNTSNNLDTIELEWSYEVGG